MEKLISHWGTKRTNYTEGELSNKQIEFKPKYKIGEDVFCIYHGDIKQGKIRYFPCLWLPEFFCIRLSEAFRSGRN